MNFYNEGELVTVRGTFKNSTGTVHNPTAVLLDVKEPESSVVTYHYASGAITKVSDGVYEKNLDTTGKRGLWIYDYYSTGGGQSDGGEQVFYVK